MSLKSARFAGSARLQRAADNSPPLRAGDTGEPVRLVQQALIDLGYEMPISVRKYGSPDGIYGAETVAQVKQFQFDNGFSPDGAAGKNTLGALDEQAPVPATKLPPLPAADKFMHRVRVHLRSINMPQVPEFTQLAVARKVYAQYSIDFQMASGMSLAMDDETRLKLNVVDGDCKWDQVSDDQRLLQDLGGREGVLPTDVIAYFATTLRKLNGETLQGCAGHPPARPAAMIAATAIDPTTLAHEVGHVLLGSSFTPVHETDSNNLMCEAAVCTGKPAYLNDAQLAAIRKSKFCTPLF